MLRTAAQVLRNAVSVVVSPSCSSNVVGDNKSQFAGCPQKVRRLGSAMSKRLAWSQGLVDHLDNLDQVLVHAGSSLHVWQHQRRQESN